MGRHNEITDGKLKYEESSFSGDVNHKKYSCCFVIPFSTYDFKSIKEEETRVRANIDKWNYDEILIEEEDYKKLIDKSNKLKILYALEGNGRS
jgi:hypothetical protein